MTPEEHDREREFDVVRTPIEVIRQGLAYASSLGLVDWRNASFLDPCAGDGRFAYVMVDSKSDVPAPSYVECVEPRSEERAALNVVSNKVTTARLQDVAIFDTGKHGAVPREGYGVIATNPPFKEWAEIAERCLTGLLAPGGMMVLYGLSTWGHSDEPSEAANLFLRHPPAAQLRIHGRVRHRCGRNPKTGRLYGTDSRKYSWWVWAPGVGPSRGWLTMNLPPLDASMRKAEPRICAAAMRDMLQTSSQRAT